MDNVKKIESDSEKKINKKNKWIKWASAEIELKKYKGADKKAFQRKSENVGRLKTNNHSNW